MENRELARIETILAINPIPDADRIEVATCGGWKIVVAKNLYKVGDLAAYFELDSKIPRRSWSEFLFKTVKQEGVEETYRLRSVRLKKCLSQGLLVPICEIPELQGIKLVSGQDVTELLKIEKYEVAIPAQLAGQVKGNFPFFLRRTDEPRIQSYRNTLDEIKTIPYYITIKCDGASATFYKKDGIFGVCSRNLDLKEEGGDSYWAIAKQLDLPEKLPEGYCVQAELVGPSIQDNHMGLKEKTILVFNVFDIAKQEFMNYESFTTFCVLLGVNTVPILESNSTKQRTMEEWIELANGLKYPSNGELAEGIVIRPMTERYSDALRGRLSFKVISNNFLLKYKE